MKPTAANRPDVSPYHRYLKPGALARLRDSKISARSHQKLPESLTHLADSGTVRSPVGSHPSAAAAAAVVLEQLPRFITYSFGPRYLKRKKLVANRSVNLPGLVERSSSESLVSLLGGGDAVAAH